MNDSMTISDQSKNQNQLVYVSECHPKNILASLSLLRSRKELCDVILEVGSKKILAHRVVLSACSPYFYAMFVGELQESKQKEVVIKDVDEHAMDLLVDFAYTSSIVIEESNVQVLLPASCLLQISEVQKACCEFLKHQLDPSNCLGIRAFADTHSCQDLLFFANKYVQENFQSVIESEEFLLLPVKQLIDIISSDELNVRSEQQVYKALRSWVNYDLADRKKNFAEALQHVRLSQLSPKFLVNNVSSDFLIKSDETCRDLVDEAKNYLLLPNERQFVNGPRFRSRNFFKKGEIIFAVGGWFDGDAIANVERYNPVTRKWTMVRPMFKRRCGVGVGVLNGLIYAVGGHDGKSYLNTIERYDPYTENWSCEVSPTSSCRTSVGVATLNDELYVIGGQDHQSFLELVEKYNPTENKWTKIASMSEKRLGVGVAVLDGFLYAIGGSNGHCPLSSVERYDPATDTWTKMPSMNTKRKHLGCTVYNNMIYVVGGRDNTNELNSAECYDPKKKQWKSIVAMNSRRSGVGLVVANGLMYAVGGFDGEFSLKTVEVYDPEKKQWCFCESMNYKRLGGGVAVVKTSLPDLFI